MSERVIMVHMRAVRFAVTLGLTLIRIRNKYEEKLDKLTEVQEDSKKFILQVQSEFEQGTITIVPESFAQLTDVPNRSTLILERLDENSVLQTILNFCIELKDPDNHTLAFSEIVSRLNRIVSDYQMMVEDEIVKTVKVIEDWNKLKDYYDGEFRKSEKFQMKKNILKCFETGFCEFNSKNNF